ncbi:MAG TPA: CoB--CoM heterodisulfide reductase iron-sulfur subunit A family protein [Thermodesulfobacteriota bacterium]|nr:CoB--CoM heterodisulfide reductase iron-sulfur subunit A family protein [Thermodesulfobacteriota bacterium]
MNKKIGVYICHCGTNIAATVDCHELSRFAGTLPGVKAARDYRYLCSDPGQDLIKKDIRELSLDRVVIAACSPRMHEMTFRNVLSAEGLNPYYLHIANIREQCSWVHPDRERATEKAKQVLRSAVARVLRQEALTARRVGITPTVLVVGAGIAGIQAALNIANAGMKVALVEKGPFIGGHMAQLDKTFPTLDCASCIFTPKTVDVARNNNIELLVCSDVTEVKGHVGNFTVTIRRNPTFVDFSRCTGCGDCTEACVLKKGVPSDFEERMAVRRAIYIPFPQAVPLKAVVDKESCLLLSKGKCKKACVEACKAEAIRFDQKEEVIEREIGSIIVATGYDPFDPHLLPQYGYGVYDNIITSLQFERLSSPSGPTRGEIRLSDGTAPKGIAFLHCIGSRDENANLHCSRICCMASMKQAHLAKEKTGAEIYEFYIDMNAFGKGYQEFYKRVREEGIFFIRGKGSEIYRKDGRLIVESEDTLLGTPVEIPVDMVVLGTGLTARRDAEKIAQVFGISRSADGFFMEAHPKLRPVATNVDGIFLAGCCQGPKDIPDTVAQASAAAAEVMSLITKGEIEVEPTTASIDPELCAGCKLCIEICAYSAIDFLETKGISAVNGALCKGCGACTAICPNKAARQNHFTQPQVLAEVEGLV